MLPALAVLSILLNTAACDAHAAAAEKQVDDGQIVPISFKKVTNKLLIQRAAERKFSYEVIRAGEEPLTFLCSRGDCLPCSNSGGASDCTPGTFRVALTCEPPYPGIPADKFPPAFESCLGGGNNKEEGGGGEDSKTSPPPNIPSTANPPLSPPSTDKDKHAGTPPSTDPTESNEKDGSSLPPPPALKKEMDLLQFELWNFLVIVLSLSMFFWRRREHRRKAYIKERRNA